MTINSLNANTSVPFTGLGTQTLNAPTTGLYTVQVRATIPWLTSDQPGYAVPTKEVQDITLVADTAGSLNSTFFTFNTTGDTVGYYVWYNINSAGVDPAPSGRTGIAVTGATGATANTLATATRAAITAAISTSVIVVTGATSHVILTNVPYGATTAAADGTAATGFTFSVTTTGSFGSGSGLVVKVKNGSTVLMTLAYPTPTQASLSGSVVSQFTAADVITVVTSSLAAIDATPNAIKGVINIFAGE